MEREIRLLILDASPVMILVGIAAGIGSAWLLYAIKPGWSVGWNRALFAARALFVSALMILLLGPVWKQTRNEVNKPVVAVIVDNSLSMRERIDTIQLTRQIDQMTNAIRQGGYDAEVFDLEKPADSIRFRGRQSDLAFALRETAGRFEGRNLASVILVSDGIYNHGLSPAYLPLRSPVYTIGVGDTTSRADVVLKNLSYNRIVYQGNKFALRAELGVSGLEDKELLVTVRRSGKVLEQVRKNSGKKSLIDFDFQLDAPEQGIQRLEVIVAPVDGETNQRNNRANAFIEVVEGKKKIVLLAPSPHPDIKAIRTVIEGNYNYELVLHIPGLVEPEVSTKIDLVIAHQSPDLEGRTSALLAQYLRAGSSVLYMLGPQANIRQLPSLGVALGFEASTQRDEVQPVPNPAFQELSFTEQVNTQVPRYPPISVPFGKPAFPATARMVLFQKIGSVNTDRPLLFVEEQEQRKSGVLLGDGVWKWRLSEFHETGKTAAFDELFSKLIQFLSTRDDRRKFRCFPIQQEFSSDGPAILESQVYNDLFEPVYGNTIDIEVRSESGEVTRHQYVTGPGNQQYRLGGLAEGIYRFKASTVLKGKQESVFGEFMVTEQNRELLNLTADFNLLRAVSSNTGGKFYTLPQSGTLQRDVLAAEMKSVIHSEESFEPMINMKTLFFLLLTLIAFEWGMRKFLGAY